MAKTRRGTRKRGKKKKPFPKIPPAVGDRVVVEGMIDSYRPFLVKIDGLMGICQTEGLGPSSEVPFLYTMLSKAPPWTKPTRRQGDDYDTNR